MNFLKVIGKFIKTNKNSILVGTGIGGLVIGGALGAVGAVRASKKIESSNFSKKDKTKIIAKELALPIILEIVSAGAIIAGFKSEHKGSVAFATACAVSESMLTDYKNKVVETIGEKKEKEIRESIAQDNIDKLDIPKTAIIPTGNGTSIVYDKRTGVVFYSNEDAIKDAVFAINEKMLDDTYANINDFYRELNVPETINNDTFGWNINRGKLKVDFYHPFGWGAPAIMIDYEAYPGYDSYFN